MATDCGFSVFMMTVSQKVRNNLRSGDWHVYDIANELLPIIGLVHRGLITPEKVRVATSGYSIAAHPFNA